MLREELQISLNDVHLMIIHIQLFGTLIDLLTFIMRAIDKQHWVIAKWSDKADPFCRRDSILDCKMVEELIRQDGDVRMHAVLYIKHREVFLPILGEFVEEGLF